MATKKTLSKVDTTLTDLQLKVETLTKERDTNALAAQNAIVIANEFGARLKAIEDTLLGSPFIQNGFFKKFLWIIRNWKQLGDLIEEILTSIKKWREYLNKLAEQQAVAKMLPA